MSNSNRFVIFPAGKLTEAQAYLAAVNSWWQANVDPEDLYAAIREDAYGQHVVAYLGPPIVFDFGNGLEELQEPEGFEVHREDGVLHDTVVWPEEDE